jgi:hypothetical protein
MTINKTESTTSSTTLATTIDRAKPYLYAGFVRSGVDRTVVLARRALVAAAEKSMPAGYGATLESMLRLPVGDAALRLLIAGVLSLKDLPAPYQAHKEALVQELVISAVSHGFDQIFDAVGAGVDLIQSLCAGAPDPAELCSDAESST